MLAKLIKYDLLFSRNNFFLFSGIFLAAALAIRLYFGFIGETVAIVGMMFGMMAIFMVAAFVLGIVAIAMTYQSYQKSFFSDHGYLMLTLPVKHGHLLLSKFLTSLFWFNFLMVVGIVATLLVASVEASMGDILGGFTFYAFVNVFYVWLLANAFGFFLLSIFFLGINLKNTFNFGLSLNWVISVGITGAIFFLWARLSMWINQTTSALTRSGDAIPWNIRFGNVYPWGWSADGHTPIRDVAAGAIPGAYQVDVNTLTVLLPLLMGGLVVVAIVTLFKRLELK